MRSISLFRASKNTGERARAAGGGRSYPSPCYRAGAACNGTGGRLEIRSVRALALYNHKPRITFADDDNVSDLVEGDLSRGADSRECPLPYLKTRIAHQL